MYKLLLILKYLFKRRIAWVSLVAVMLCVMMVIVVNSIMGGWLKTFRESFHGLNGDIIVQGQSLVGFPHYEEMISKIEAIPEVEAASPVIRSFGLINILNVKRKPVQVIGFPLERIKRVNTFYASIGKQEGLSQGFELRDDVPYELILPKAKNVRNRPAMIVGSGVVDIGKGPDGKLIVPMGLTEWWATLTMVGISVDDANVNLNDKQVTPYWIVNYSRTQAWQYDSQTVYVPFEQVQKDLKMEAFDEQPARTHDIQIKVKKGVDVDVARSKIVSAVREVIQSRLIGSNYPIAVMTWEETQAMWLEAVENEKGLMTLLFGIISIVAVFLIFCIFYMIVMEKTKDIGIIKSVGATSAGVAGIFLGYGLAIGIVGAGMGLLLAYLIIHNINYINDGLLPSLGFSPIWKPEIYAFDTIPSTMNPHEVAIILTVAVVSSVVGALLPAFRAGEMNPVEALRWE